MLHPNDARRGRKIHAVLALANDLLIAPITFFVGSALLNRIKVRVSVIGRTGTSFPAFLSHFSTGTNGDSAPPLRHRHRTTYRTLRRLDLSRFHPRKADFVVRQACFDTAMINAGRFKK